MLSRVLRLGELENPHLPNNRWVRHPREPERINLAEMGRSSAPLQHRVDAMTAVNVEASRRDEAADGARAAIAD